MPSKLHGVPAHRRNAVLLRAILWILITACTALLLFHAPLSDVWRLKRGEGGISGLPSTGSAAAWLAGTDVRTPLHKPCAKGCTQHGNCNFEEGRCECAWGYGGEDCSQLKLSACRQSTEAWAPMHTGKLPKACECYRQLWALSEEIERVGAWDKRMPDRNKSVCFERTSLPPEAQLSHFPEEDEQDVRYFRGIFPPLQEELQRNETLLWEQFAQWIIQPPSTCRNQCSRRGYCLKKTFDLPETAPFCECYFGWQGDDCSEPRTGEHWGQYQCVNNCSDVGACRSGFCHCPPGRFGIACHRTEAWAPREHRPDPSRLRIYVYELPVTLAQVELLDYGQHHFVSEFFQGFYPIYSATHQFFRQLLADDVLTQDPYEASLFYVPSWMLQYTTEFHNPVPHMMKVITYIRQKQPFYEANAGRDHIWFLPRDKGACAEWGPAGETKSGIKLVHWGYRGEAAGGTFGWLGNCFDRKKDVCVVPFYDNAPQQASQVYTAQALQAAAAVAGQNAQQEEVVLPLGIRSTLFFFSGNTRDDVTWYSGGVRQQVVKLHKNATGFEFKVGYHSFEEQMRNSMFCLAPSGLGWGIRLPQCTASGCIPVIIQDGIDQYHEDVLDYERFAVRVAQKDIPDLPQILNNIGTHERAELQRGLVELHRALMWGPAPFDAVRVAPERRGLAYNYTVESLRRSYRNFVIERTLINRTAVVQPLSIVEA